MNSCILHNFTIEWGQPEKHVLRPIFISLPPIPAEGVRVLEVMKFRFYNSIFGHAALRPDQLNYRCNTSFKLKSLTVKL